MDKFYICPTLGICICPTHGTYRPRFSMSRGWDITTIFIFMNYRVQGAPLRGSPASRPPLPRERSRSARVFFLPRFFLGSSVCCTSGARLNVLHCSIARAVARSRFAPILTRSVLAFGCAPHAASGLALAPALHRAGPWQHRHAPEVQIKSKPIWYGKKNGASRFLRAVPFLTS